MSHLAIRYVCPHCGRWFETPSVCIESGCVTERRLVRLPDA